MLNVLEYIDQLLEGINQVPKYIDQVLEYIDQVQKYIDQVLEYIDQVQEYIDQVQEYINQVLEYIDQFLSKKNPKIRKFACQCPIFYFVLKIKKKIVPSKRGGGS